MSLPKLEYPTYMTKLPLSGENIKYRPFTVGEEKVLLTAVEGDNYADVDQAIAELIECCTFNTLKVKDMFLIDVEWIFLQIRAKSVGPEIPMSYQWKACQREEPCERTSQISIDIDQIIAIGVEDVEPTKTIDLYDGMALRVAFPKFDQMSKTAMADPETREVMLIAYSLGAVITEENTYTDFTIEDAMEFVLSMTVDQRAKVMDYLNAMPLLKFERDMECQDCGATGKIDLRGMQNFFVLG